MRKLKVPFWGTLLLGVMFLCGCERSQPESSVQQEKKESSVMTKSDLYFRYTIPDWPLRFFGPKFNTFDLCSVALDLDVDVDLVSQPQWEILEYENITLSCVLPDMGTDSDGVALPPFGPGFVDSKHYNRVHNVLSAALDNAKAADVKYILVFTGMDAKENRDVQFSRIVAGYIKPKDGDDESLIEKAERLGITFVIEMLNTEGDEATWRGHPGYLGNSTDELVQKVVEPIGSDNFKLAFDVYHIVMMGEDPLKMIEKHHAHIGYVHVAGVMKADEGHHPQNRGELNLPGQKVDYATIMVALAEHLPKDTYVLLEYIPNKSDSETVQADLLAAINLCESKIE